MFRKHKIGGNQFLELTSEKLTAMGVSNDGHIEKMLGLARLLPQMGADEGQNKSAPAADLSDAEIATRLAVMRTTLGIPQEQVTDDQLRGVLFANGGNVELAVNAYFSQQDVQRENNSDLHTAVAMQHEDLQSGVEQMRAVIGDSSNATQEVLETYLSAAGGSVERAIEHYFASLANTPTGADAKAAESKVHTITYTYFGSTALNQFINSFLNFPRMASCLKAKQ